MFVRRLPLSWSPNRNRAADHSTWLQFFLVNLLPCSSNGAKICWNLGSGDSSEPSADRTPDNECGKQQQDFWLLRILTPLSEHQTPSNKWFEHPMTPPGILTALATKNTSVYDVIRIPITESNHASYLWNRVAQPKEPGCFQSSIVFTANFSSRCSMASHFCFTASTGPKQWQSSRMKKTWRYLQEKKSKWE